MKTNLRFEFNSCLQFLKHPELTSSPAASFDNICLQFAGIKKGVQL
jgi:hypothetical protein